MNTALLELRGAASLIADPEISAALVPVMRRLRLAEVLGHQQILAIGGSQGAGKTTFICTLYGLEPHWLVPNEGRGETLPVLIVEEAGRTQAEGFLQRLTKASGERHYTLKGLEDGAAGVDAQAFQRALGGHDPEVLLPVLKVPPKYFQGRPQAWLLLPGYEMQNRRNQVWQELMRQALVGAGGCVIVTDETRLADQQQVEIAQDMLAQELHGCQPLVLVAKTEAARHNPEKLQSLRQTAQQVFGIASEHFDRFVICTGSDDAGYVAQWLPQVRTAIQALCAAGGRNRKAQLARLAGVLQNDLLAITNDIRMEAEILFRSQGADGESGEAAVLQRCLEAFDDAQVELRDMYQQGLDEMLHEQFSQALPRLNEKLKQDHVGLSNAFQRLVLRNAIEDQELLASAVQSAWNGGGVQAAGGGSEAQALLLRHADMVGGITRKKLGVKPAVAAACASPGSSSLKQLGYVDASGRPVGFSKQADEDLHNLGALIGERPQEAHGVQAAAPTTNLERSVKMLPVLALEYVRMANVRPDIVKMDPQSLNAPSGSATNPVAATVAHVGAGVDLGKTLMRSVATVLAVDVAVDGEANLLAGVGGAALAGGVASAVVGGVAIGYLAFTALSSVRQGERDVSAAARFMLQSMRDHHRSHFLDHFDRLMREVRTHMKQQLRKRFHLDERLMEQDRLAKALADVRALQRDLLYEIGRSGRSVDLFEAPSAA